MKAADTKLQFLQHIIFISAVFSSCFKKICTTDLCVHVFICRKCFLLKAITSSWLAGSDFVTPLQSVSCGWVHHPFYKLCVYPTRFQIGFHGRVSKRNSTSHCTHQIIINKFPINWACGSSCWVFDLRCFTYLEHRSSPRKRSKVCTL